MKKKLLLTLLIVIGLISGINYISSALITKKVNDILVKNNAFQNGVEYIKIDLWNQSVKIINPRFAPNQEKLDSLANSNLDTNHLENFASSSIEFNGVGFWKLLTKMEIEIDELTFNDFTIHQFQNSKIKDRKPKKDIQFDIESISIKEINYLEIESISFKNFNYRVYDLGDRKLTFQTNKIDLNASGVKLVKVRDTTFKLLPTKDKFAIKDINLSFEKSHYNFNIGELSFDFINRSIEVSDLKLHPSIPKKELAKKYKFNNDIYSVDIPKLEFKGISLKRFIKDNDVFIDTIILSNLDLKLFKDKHKPFDTKKRPKLPHTALKKMSMDVDIKEIQIIASNITLEELLADNNLEMQIPISELNANIYNVSNIRENTPMTINASASIFDSKQASLEAIFRMENNTDDYFFKGELKNTHMSIFDRALFPVLGLKILSGKIDNLSFYANGDSESATGKMTFEYHDLKAEVFKKDSDDANKFLSWTVNRVIHKSNPRKGSKYPVEVDLEFERVKHKGMGNIFWKTIQDGLIKTIAPIGGKHKHKKKKD